MRSSYRTLIWRLVRRAKFRALARIAGTGLRIRRGRRLQAPLFVTMAVTYRCNYRCGMCDFPERADPEFLSSEKIISTLRSFAKKGTVAVGLTGGEPTLRKDLEEIVRQAKSMGLIVHLNTNGSALSTDRSRSLLTTGLDSINLSLDGARPETHNRLRGVEDSFSDVVNTVARLVSLRDEMRLPTRIRLVMAISPDNADEIVDLVALASRIKADGVGFLPVHPLPGESAISMSQSMRDRLATALKSLREGEHHHLLENSPAYLSGIVPFFDGKSTPEVCSAPESHVAIDPRLRLFPCVPMMTHEMGQCGKVSDGWNPEEARRQVNPSLCRQCWWNCHRELDIALGKIDSR